MVDILQMTFWNALDFFYHFWWLDYFIQITFAEGSIADKSIIDAGNGLAPHRWQAITRINDNPSTDIHH